MLADIICCFSSTPNGFCSHLYLLCIPSDFSEVPRGISIFVGPQKVSFKFLAEQSNQDD